MAVLAWVKSKKEFLKVQEGIGDNLLHEDVVNGYVDYVLWSTFKPECIDIDQSLEMGCVDSGMVMGKESMSAELAIDGCYREAYGCEPFEGDVVVLMVE